VGEGVEDAVVGVGVGDDPHPGRARLAGLRRQRLGYLTLGVDLLGLLGPFWLLLGVSHGGSLALGDERLELPAGVAGLHPVLGDDDVAAGEADGIGGAYRL